MPDLDHRRLPDGNPHERESRLARHDLGRLRAEAKREVRRRKRRLRDSNDPLDRMALGYATNDLARLKAATPSHALVLALPLRALRRTSTSSGRPRPQASRRASTSRDDGEPGEGEPALALAPRPRALYTFALLSAADRGADVEPVRDTRR